MQKAAGLAAKIKETCDIEAKLIEGSSGIFDIAVDGKLIYSKQKTGVFPDESEIIKIINEI
ncbi:MAG: Rdx family protein [Nitrospirota bacterium]